MTDVTGFGLLGPLARFVKALDYKPLFTFTAPRLPEVEAYIEQGCVPGGTGRNFLKVMAI